MHNLTHNYLKLVIFLAPVLVCFTKGKIHLKVVISMHGASAQFISEMIKIGNSLAPVLACFTKERKNTVQTSPQHVIPCNVLPIQVEIKP